MRHFADHYAWGLGVALASLSATMGILRMARLAPGRLADSWIWAGVLGACSLGLVLDVALRLAFAG